MSRIPLTKQLFQTRLANTYGGWIYCENCGKNIGYLCYVTYDSFKLNYQCKCGGHGSMYINFRDVSLVNKSDKLLVLNKNRLCCPSDMSPLFTILEKNLDYFEYDVVCNQCDTRYSNAGVQCKY